MGLRSSNLFIWLCHDYLLIRTIIEYFHRRLIVISVFEFNALENAAMIESAHSLKETSIDIEAYVNLRFFVVDGYSWNAIETKFFWRFVALVIWCFHSSMVWLYEFMFVEWLIAHFSFQSLEAALTHLIGVDIWIALSLLCRFNLFCNVHEWCFVVWLACFRRSIKCCLIYLLFDRQEALVLKLCILNSQCFNMLLEGIDLHSEQGYFTLLLSKYLIFLLGKGLYEYKLSVWLVSQVICHCNAILALFYLFECFVLSF